MKNKKQISAVTINVSRTDIENLIARREGLPEGSVHLGKVAQDCYCYDEEAFCFCPPASLEFTHYVTDPNFCGRCNAKGVEPCRTIGGSSLGHRWHKDRANEDPADIKQSTRT